MLLFCPRCGNMLVTSTVTSRTMEDRGNCFKCPTCPFAYRIRKKVAEKKFTTLKSVDDVLGGEGAWKNVETTNVTCPQCSHDSAYFMQMQTRSADEPMTIFYRCCECRYQWRD